MTLSAISPKVYIDWDDDGEFVTQAQARDGLLVSIGNDASPREVSKRESSTWEAPISVTATTGSHSRLRLLTGDLWFTINANDNGVNAFDASPFGLGSRSEDGGATWGETPQPGASGSIRDIARAPDGRLWCIVHDSDTGFTRTAIYYSDDDADTWTLSTTHGSGASAEISQGWRIMCHPTDPNIIAIMGHSSGFPAPGALRGYILYTANQGDDWTINFDAGLSIGQGGVFHHYDAAITSSARIFAVGFLGGGLTSDIYYTDDYGANWVSVYESAGLTVITQGIFISADETSVAVIVTDSGDSSVQLWLSTDSGDSFARASLGTELTETSVTTMAASADTIYIATTSEEIYQLTPVSASGVWTDISSGFQHAATGNDHLGVLSALISEEVTSDVLDISWDRGRSSVNDQMAMGTATVTLLNSSGDYSPFKTGSPIYPNMVPGRKVKIEIVHDSITYSIFFGRISEISQGLTPDSAPTIELSLEDEFGRLSRSRYRSDASLLAESLTSTNIGLIIGQDFLFDIAFSFEAGVQTMTPFAYDGTHLEALRQCAHQELGGSMFMGAGGSVVNDPVLTFYNREHRSAQAVHATFVGPQALDMQLREGDWIDEVVHKRAGLDVDTDVTAIYNLFPTSRTLELGTTSPSNTIHGRYINSAKDVIEPEPHTDYTVNARADGTGQDLTDQVSVDSWTSFGGGFSITFDNASGIEGKRLELIIRGIAIRQTGEAREIIISDASAPVKDQTLQDTFDFNDDVVALKGYAMFRLYAGTTYYPRLLDVLLRPRDDSEAADILGLDLAKRLTITNTTGMYPSEINADFFAERIRGSYTPAGGLVYRCTLWHEIAALGNFFRISGASGGGQDYSQISGDADTVGDRVAF